MPSSPPAPGASAGVRNLLLRALPRAELDGLLPFLERVPFPLGMAVIVEEAPVDAVHFVEVGTVSMITTMEDGARIEVGLVGPEGFTGLALFLGAPNAPLEGQVQVDGSALRLPAAALRRALADLPGLLPLMLRYVDSFHAQVAQTAACNGRHAIEQRLARWLLMTHDRAGGNGFPMTQEFLSTMLGVRRPGVTLAMGALQRAGLVRAERGRVAVLDRPGLEAASCECHGIVRDRFAWLTGPRPHENHGPSVR